MRTISHSRSTADPCLRGTMSFVNVELRLVERGELAPASLGAEPQHGRRDEQRQNNAGRHRIRKRPACVLQSAHDQWRQRTERSARVVGEARSHGARRGRKSFG
jgi:hypothetical protein